MSLNAKYLPVYNYREEHSLDIVGSPEEVMREIINYRADRDTFFRYAIALREFPQRLLQPSKPSPAPFSLDNFTLLERNADQEVIWGLVGQFWKFDYGQAVIDDRESFLAFEQLDYAKLTLYFSIQQLDDLRCRVSTETRVACLGPKALFKFRPYWYLIRPVSGLIRHRILAQIQKNIAQSRKL